MSEYTCDQCGGAFQDSWSEADAIMEYQQTWTEEERAADDAPPARLCDPCYREVMKLVADGCLEGVAPR